MTMRAENRKNLDKPCRGLNNPVCLCILLENEVPSEDFPVGYPMSILSVFESIKLLALLFILLKDILLCNLKIKPCNRNLCSFTRNLYPVCACISLIFYFYFYFFTLKKFS